MIDGQKVAVVTGGTRGLGRAIAEGLARDGYHVVVNWRASASTADEVVASITAAGGSATSIRADVSVREDVVRMVDEVVHRCGRIDVLVNNAGVNIDRPFLSMSAQDWSTVLRVNLDGAFHCTQLVAATMMERRTRGNIVNLSASTALRGRKDGANYCAAKAGVIALTKCTALELAPLIRVNCIAPGFMETDEVNERFSLADPDRRSAIVSTIPLGRIGHPREIADMVSFLCTDKASYITGQILFVNGGNYTG